MTGARSHGQKNFFVCAPLCAVLCVRVFFSVESNTDDEIRKVNFAIRELTMSFISTPMAMRIAHIPSFLHLSWLVRAVWQWQRLKRNSPDRCRAHTQIFANNSHTIEWWVMLYAETRPSPFAVTANTNSCSSCAVCICCYFLFFCTPCVRSHRCRHSALLFHENVTKYTRKGFTFSSVSLRKWNKNENLLH